MNYFKRKGQLHSSPEPGDVIFFWNSAKKEASHVGIVEKVDGSYVYTIEGNTSNKSGVVANGGAVASKKYNLANNRIAGYGRPDYASAMPNSDYKIQNNEEVSPMTEGKAWVTVEKGSTVNFRQKASTSSAKVVGMPTIKKGEEVTVIGGDQTWATVEYKGYHGYVM